MTNRKGLTASPSWISIAAMISLLSGLSVYPTRVEGQTQAPSKEGQSAIYQSSTGVVNSQAFVDALPFYNPPQNDICSVINYILITDFQGGGNSNGVIIDARGITSTSPLPCLSNPFAGLTNGANLSSTILLPAATIQTTHAWVLPSNARVYGEGQGLTILQAKSGFADTDMIDLGSSGFCPGNPLDCQGNGIEHLTLDAHGLASINGIHNTGSEELSYVNDVALANVLGTGLWIDGGGADNSGPYSNIYFNGSGTCVRINGTGSRGVHGLTCITNVSSGPLVYLDAPNNSIEDVTLTYVPGNGSGAPDGILVGSQTTGVSGAQSDVLVNITGNNLADVIHISRNTNTQSNCTPQNFVTRVSVNNVCDLTVLGVANSGSTTTINDELTNTTLNDATVGMYIIGEQVPTGGTSPGNSRFTTSPSFPTWLVGSGPPGTSCSGTGSLYSDTSGTPGATLLTCVNGSWKKVK